MSTIIKHDGTVIQMPNYHTLWSKVGGTFTDVAGDLNYFPLPSDCSNALRTSGSYVIPAKYEGRPDLIAKALYGSEDYWWVVLWASHIIDPFTLVTGYNIRVVNIADVIAMLQ